MGVPIFRGCQFSCDTGSVLAAKGDPAGHACTKCIWTCLVFMYWQKKDVFFIMHACMMPLSFRINTRNGFVDDSTSLYTFYTEVNNNW